MSKIRSKNTKIELLFRRRLYAEGMRYRANYSSLFGKPDIVFLRKKVAVFIDGDWWHGRNYENEFRRYPLFWQTKIRKNIDRDSTVNEALRAIGWSVLRFWQKDIAKDPDRYVQLVKEAIS